MSKVNIKRFFDLGVIRHNPITRNRLQCESLNYRHTLIEGKSGVYVHHHEEKTLTRLIILRLEPLRITTILCAVDFSSPDRPVSTSCLKFNIS